MKEVLHHVRFDLLRLRWWLLLWLVLAICFGQGFPVGEVPLPGGPWVIGLVILGLLLIRQHNLPGDRNWWVSRPIGRRELALSKLVFGTLIAIIWLVGGAIHLLVAGFHPLAVTLFQLESVPLLIGLTLAFLHFTSITRTWREMVGMTIAGFLSAVWIAMMAEEVSHIFQKQDERFWLNETWHPYLSQAFNWEAEAGFLGGLFLCAGFILAFLHRIRHRHRVLRAFSFGLLVLVGATTFKVVLLPDPLARIEPGPPEAVPEPVQPKLLGDDAKWTESNIAGALDLSFPLELKNPDGLSSTESVEVPFSFALIRSEDGKRGATGTATLRFGELKSAWKAFGISGESPAHHTAWIQLNRIVKDWFGFASDKDVYIRRLIDDNRLNATVFNAESWMRIPLRPGVSKARGIYRIEIDPHEFHRSEIGPSYSLNPQVHNGSYETLLVDVRMRELRFRLNRNPGIGWFGLSEEIEWFGFLLDSQGRPVTPTLDPLYDHRFKTGSHAGLSFPVPEGSKDDEFELAIVRMAPRSVRPVRFELPDEIPLPEIPD